MSKAANHSSRTKGTSSVKGTIGKPQGCMISVELKSLAHGPAFRSGRHRGSVSRESLMPYSNIEGVETGIPEVTSMDFANVRVYE